MPHSVSSVHGEHGRVPGKPSPSSHVVTSKPLAHSMFPTRALAILSTLAVPIFSSADVTLTRLEDRVRVEVDGQLFTEYRFREWADPYLFPVVGPNGETVTRHYPIEEARPGEATDHPHHRSIRFSHRGVNGFSFWAPQSNEGGHIAKIELDSIESITSGPRGDLVLWNRWIGDDAVQLRERKRLAFTPLEHREMLVDYDVELFAPEDRSVTFSDQKDGGLSVRVAATMNVIRNSRGETNDDAWGRRAEWADFSGPDASGKPVGIAIFDHPSNLRFPTWWHARTYGLLCANRFGIGDFDKANGAQKGDGDHTIPPGGSLKLRHRLYLHHGNSETGAVARQFEAYAAESAP